MRAADRVPYVYVAGGLAAASIWVSVVLASVFSPDMVSGAQQEHIPIAAVTDWIWGAMATSALAAAVLEGVRSRTATRESWTAAAGVVGVLWAAVVPVSVFSPVLVTGTDPTRLPLAAIGGPILAMVATRFVCNFVRSASTVEEAAPSPPAVAPAPARSPLAGEQPAESSAAARLRELASLREAGVITAEEFEAKKEDLLARI